MNLCLWQRLHCLIGDRAQGHLLGVTERKGISQSFRATANWVVFLIATKYLLGRDCTPH